jgi:hypothetical protein
MIDLHLEILKKNGRNEFVVLPYEEFVALQEWMADAQDLLDLEAAKGAEGDGPRVPLEVIERELGLA